MFLNCFQIKYALHVVSPYCITNSLSVHFSLVAALNTYFRCMITRVISAGMNAAVRAVTRMGIYVGAKVYLIYEVSDVAPHALSHGALLSYWCMCFSRVIKVWWMEEITSNSPTGRASPTSFSWWVFICFNACLSCLSHACVMLPYVLLEVNLMKQFRKKVNLGLHEELIGCSLITKLS